MKNFKLKSFLKLKKIKKQESIMSLAKERSLYEEEIKNYNKINNNILSSTKNYNELSSGNFFISMIEFEYNNIKKLKDLKKISEINLIKIKENIFNLLKNYAKRKVEYDTVDSFCKNNLKNFLKNLEKKEQSRVEELISNRKNG